MRVSLVICSYNRMHTLPRTLESVSFLRYEDLEVIVVDGPSDDGTEAYLNAYWHGKIKILKCPVANLSVSRNIGIHGASGDIVVFTDDDGMPEPDWLNKLIPAYDDPRVAAVGGWVRDHTGVDYQTKYIVSHRNSLSDVLIDSEDTVPASVPFAKSIPGLIGVNSSFRKTTLLEVGGFDEEYAYFLDETDVLIRLVDAGYRIKMVPDAQVHHKYAASHIRTEKGLPKTWYQIAKSTAYFCLRNAAPSQPLQEVLSFIAQHKRERIENTNWAASTEKWSEVQRNEMLQTLELGIAEGIQDAFSQPWRTLISKTNCQPDWLLFPRKLPYQNRLKLALVTELYPPRPCGGVAVFMQQLAEALASQGHEITVITFAESGRCHTVDFEKGVWVHRIQPSVSSLSQDGLADMPINLNRAAQSVLAEIDRVNGFRQLDWVLGAIWDLPIAAVIASERYRVALYLVTSYGLMLDSKPEWKQNQHFMKHHVEPMMKAETWALEKSNLILSSTEAIKRDCENIYKVSLNRAVILPFGLREGLVSKSDRHDNLVKILYVGRFEHRKGIDLLLECLPSLFERHQCIEVSLVGDYALEGDKGCWQAFVKSHSSKPWFKKIEVPGVVSDEDLDKYYSECDIFVAPSRYESFGLIYLEAMRYGKPCVGFSVGGVPEVVLHKETGLLSTEVSATALQQCLVAMIEDPSLREQMGLVGKKRFDQLFTVERFASAFVSQLKNFSVCKVQSTNG